MKGAGFFLSALLALAVLQAAVKVVAALIILAIVWGVFAYPAQTFGLLAFCLVAGLIDRHPLACIGGMVALTVAVIVREST